MASKLVQLSWSTSAHSLLKSHAGDSALRLNRPTLLYSSLSLSMHVRRRSLRLELSDARVYEPGERAHSPGRGVLLLLSLSLSPSVSFSLSLSQTHTNSLSLTDERQLEDMMFTPRVRQGGMCCYCSRAAGGVFQANSKPQTLNPKL